MSTRGIRSLIVGAAVAVASTVAVAPLATSAAGGGSRTGDVPARLERACARVPNLQRRTDNVIARLNADASTRGSLAWLQARIDTAAAEGRTEAVTVLENRLAVRTAQLDVLVARQAALTEIARICAEHGVGQ